MTIRIKAQVIKREDPQHTVEKPWTTRAVAYDYEPDRDRHPMIRTTKSAYAHSFPEALQLAHVARQKLSDALMDEVHASRSRRRTNPETNA